MFSAKNKYVLRSYKLSAVCELLSADTPRYLRFAPFFILIDNDNNDIEPDLLDCK